MRKKWGEMRKKWGEMRKKWGDKCEKSGVKCEKHITNIRYMLSFLIYLHKKGY